MADLSLEQLLVHEISAIGSKDCLAKLKYCLLFVFMCLFYLTTRESFTRMLLVALISIVSSLTWAQVRPLYHFFLSTTNKLDIEYQGEHVKVFATICRPITSATFQSIGFAEKTSCKKVHVIGVWFIYLCVSVYLCDLCIHVSVCACILYLSVNDRI